MAPQLRDYVAESRVPASGLCIWYSPRYVLFQQSLRWKHWYNLGLGTLCPVPLKQPGQGGWRGVGFLKILKPHSHTSLIPSLPKPSVVFSCGFFTNPDLGSYRSSCFQLQELKGGCGQKRSYSHQISSVATEWQALAELC